MLPANRSHFFIFLSALLVAAGTTQADNAVESIVLDKIAVTGEHAESKNYQVGQSITATKTGTALIDVPQSIAIVTGEQIKDQQMLSLGDVARYVPGIGVHQG